MREILYNLALIDTTNYCKENNIDCSGTYLYKQPRKQTYILTRFGQEPELYTMLVSVTFHKNQVPTHSIINR